MLGSLLLFGIFLLLDCFVSSAISGLHLRAPNGVLNFYKFNVIIGRSLLTVELPKHKSMLSGKVIGQICGFCKSSTWGQSN